MSDITANVVVSMPSQLFTMPRSFKAVANGKIYIGQIDTDPVNPANQIQVYLENEDGSHVPVSQPLIINAGGYPVYNGQIAKFVTVQGHSMAVYDAFNAQQFYYPNVLKYDPDQLRQELSGSSGAALVGYGNATLNDVASSIYVPDFSSALSSSFPSSIKTMTIVKYHADSTGEFNTAHATNVMRRTNETGTPGQNDGGSWLIDANGSKWVTTLPIHVDRFGAYPGTGVSSFDSGPAFQNAIIAAGKDRYGQRVNVECGNYVYTIKSKVLITQNIRLIGNGTSIVSDSDYFDDFIIETGYYSNGVLLSNTSGISDEDCIANARIQNTSIERIQFIGIEKCLNLRCFTSGCYVSDVTFDKCGNSITSVQSFYSKYNVEVIGDSSKTPGDYSIKLGRASNLVECVARISHRDLGVSLSEEYNSSYLQNNTQNVTFAGSSFEFMNRAITLCGDNFSTNINEIYCESVTTVLGKLDGDFKSHNLKIGDGGWMYNVTTLVNMYGLVDSEISLSDYGTELTQIKLVNTESFKNTCIIRLKTQKAFVFPKADIMYGDNIKYEFNYLLTNAIYDGQEIYAITPIYADCDCSYELKATSSDGTISIYKQGRMTRFNTISFGDENSYVSQNSNGDTLIHFKNLPSSTYPWLSGGRIYISLWQ